MIKRLTYFIFICFAVQSQAQEVTNISGLIGGDALSLENIHIFNKTSRKGTVSDKEGAFVIPVILGDTLAFFGIQFYYEEVVINNTHIEDRRMTVYLIQKVNELEVVELKNNNLSGSLNIDAGNVKKPISMVNESALDFSNIDFSVVNDIDAIDRSKAPDPFTGTSAQVQKGISLLFVFKPILKGISKIGERKRSRKKAEKIFEKKIEVSPDIVRKEMGDAFFINTLKIPLYQIDAFLTYCKSKGLMPLYLKGKKIEFIEALIAESAIFREGVKN